MIIIEDYFLSFCPSAYAASRLTGMLKYLSIGVSVLSYTYLYILPPVLAKQVGVSAGVFLKNSSLFS